MLSTIFYNRSRFHFDAKNQNILNAAVRWQVIAANPCVYVDALKISRKEAVALDESDAERLITCLQSEPVKYRVAVMLSLCTGMRENPTKTESSKRLIHIPTGMIELLRLHREEYSRLSSVLGDQWAGSGKVFTNNTGGLLNPDTLSSWFKKIY